MSCLLASCVCLCAESKTNKNYICIYIWETTSSGSWNTLHLCLQITVLRIVCKLQEHRCTWKAPAARQPQKQAQAQDQSSWRSKNKICTHCLFTTDLISSEYKQSDSVITKYLGCKIKHPKDWKCSTGGYYTELFGMATFKMLSLFSPHCTSEHLKQNEASRSFFSSLLLPNFTKRNKSESYFSISKISSSSRVAPSIIKAILYFLMNIIRRCNCWWFLRKKQQAVSMPMA